MRQARTNIAKGESRANGSSANWHDRAELYALRRSAKIAKVCKAGKRKNLFLHFLATATDVVNVKTIFVLAWLRRLSCTPKERIFRNF